MNISKSISVQQVGIHVLRVFVCIVLVAAITWIAFSVLNVNALIVGFAYVLAVLVVAVCGSDALPQLLLSSANPVPHHS